MFLSPKFYHFYLTLLNADVNFEVEMKYPIEKTIND
jgi:hypothetical protein